MLAVHLYLIYRPTEMGWRLTTALATVLLVPFLLEPVSGKAVAIAVALPTLLLLDDDLKQGAGRYLNFANWPSSGVRRPTSRLKTMAVALFLLLLVSIVFNNMTLTLAIALPGLYLMVMSTYILSTTPKSPIQVAPVSVRIVAGHTGQFTVTINSRAKLLLHTLWRPGHSWVTLNPERLELGKKEAKLESVIIPPLSGPAKIQIQAAAVDSRGLIQTSQLLEPVELFVIPRARYAEWLAKKYLEQTAGGVSLMAGVFPPAKAAMGGRRGVEYYDNRLYQPGDRLKDIDWKRTLKLHELIVKEYLEARGQGVILVVNLTAADAEQADWLVYSFITSALTLAREGVPTAIAAYNNTGVIASTPMVDPRETLKRALRLAQGITLLQFPARFLQQVDIRRLKRTIDQLGEAKSGPARRLRSILRFEQEAVERAASIHPATEALLRTVAHVPAPALAVVISSTTDDDEPLAVTLSRLKNRGYKSLRLERDGLLTTAVYEYNN